MKDNLLKKLAKTICFRPEAVRRIRLGPLRGMDFRVSAVTGLSAWYSGTERGHQRIFKALVRPGDVVIDVGGNWGLHTLYLSRLAGRDGSVIVMEPFPPAFTELEWHIRANACQNVKALQVAIGDVDSDALFCPGSSASTGSLSAVCSAPSISRDAISVTVRTLDSVIEELGIETLKLVKVDVEGAEGSVLLGSQRIIERYRPYFVIDLHTPEQDLFVAKWLTDRGYRLERLSGPPILRTDRGWPDPAGVWGSIVASPLP